MAVNCTQNFRQVGTASWSNLGEKVELSGEFGISVKDALIRSKANYDVNLQPIVALTPELVEAMKHDKNINAGDLMKYVIDGRKATMRMDNFKPLGCVSDGYGVYPNEKMFNLLGMLASGKDMNREDVPIVETAGVIDGGRRVFVTMRMPLPIRINTAADDIVNMYLIAQNSFDGSGNLQIAITPIRQWCSNQIAMIFKKAPYKISFRHTRYINERIDLMNEETAQMAYRTLGIYDVYKKHFEAELENLRSIKISDKQAESIIAESLLSEDVFKIFEANGGNIFHEDIPTRSQNIFTNAMEAFHDGVGQNNRELAGTGLHVINGLSTLFQNHSTFKNEEKKFISITEGNCFNKLQKAHELILMAA